MFASVLRWIARLSALLIAGAYGLLVIGEITQPHSGPPTKFLESAGIALLTSTCIGMLIAWRWELPGAIASLASLVAFALIVRMRRHGILVVFAIPGILFVVDWLARRFTLPRTGRV